MVKSEIRSLDERLISGGKIMQKINKDNLKSDKAKDFCKELDSHNTDLNTFLKLFNKWSDMNTKERGECIDNLLWK